MFYLLHPSNPHFISGLQEEILAFQNVFGGESTGSNLVNIPERNIVIPRYRMLPFGKELEEETLSTGSKLINTYRQHRNIANISTWVSLLEGLTPPVYEQHDIPYLPEGEWFVKGETNSIKNRWFECCYAPTTKDLPQIVRANQLDTYVGNQTIYIRPFQHYRQVGTAVDNRPVFNEKRIFIYKGQPLSSGDYWVTQPDAINIEPLNITEYERVLAAAITATEHLADFYVIDLAEYPDGSWGVVELNDGSMSGLSANAPEKVWSMLKKTYEERGR